MLEDYLKTHSLSELNVGLKRSPAVCRLCGAERDPRGSLCLACTSHHAKVRARLKRSVEWRRLRVACGGLCQGCGERAPLELDHDYETETLRGALCGPCNRALGQARDDPKVLRGLAEYLERTGSR